MYPYLISVLVVLRLKNPDLYLEFRDGKCFSSKVVDYIDEEIPVIKRESQFSRHLDSVESQLYLIHPFRFAPDEIDSSPLVQLNLLQGASIPLTHPEYLSKRTAKSDGRRIDQLLPKNRPIYGYLKIKDICNLIELSGAIVQE